MIPFGMFKPGAAPVVPGTITYSTPGAYSFVVPAFNTLEVHVYGGGGSGVIKGAASVAGGASAWNNGQPGEVRANGGQPNGDGNPGLGGTATGGDVNTAGEAGAVGYGGANLGPQGGARQTSTHTAGNPYGGGGRGAGTVGGGGGSGYARKTFAIGALTVGASVPLLVGAGGSVDTRSGADGAVVISWS